MKFEEFEKQLDKIVETFKANARADKTLPEWGDKIGEGDWLELFVLFYKDYRSV